MTSSRSSHSPAQTATRTRQWLSRRQQQYQTYQTSAILCDEGDAATATKEKSSDEQAADAAATAAMKLRNKLAARDFNNRRAAYKRQVSLLRREYAEEVTRQRAADKAEKEALERELTRQRLERQRHKNIRSAQNAIRQEEMRKEREREFEKHLRQMQIKRDATNVRFMKARQLLVDELEEVAHLWLTTPDEVEAAFTPEAEQLLWAHPGGILGEPNPSLDAHFWQYETHTWHMDRTYKSQRQVLLEELEEMAYNEANVDKSFWTEERLEDRTRLEDKARLRGMVQTAGRIQLLKKQKELLEEQQNVGEGEIPKPIAAPSNRVLRDEQAQEQEGAKLLLENPTKFFLFEGTSLEQGANSEEQKSYSGPTLGSPIGLRDPLREKSHQNRVFPYMIGKYPKPDMRTEREKKQQERMERMWAAAHAEARSDVTDVDLAAQDQEVDDLGPDLDYNNIEWDSDEEEWNHGLDPEADKEILNTPRERRYSEDDIDWVLGELEGKVQHLEQQFSQDMEGLKQSMKAELQADSSGAAAEPNDLEQAILALSAEELMLLSDLDESHESMSPGEFAEAIQNINLSEDQIKFILQRDRSD